MPHQLNRRRLMTAGAAGSLAFAIAPEAFARTTPPAAAPVEVPALARALLEKNYPADGPGAAVLVARGDRVLFRGARGLANLETHAPLTADGLFRIGSVTKQMAAAGLLKLVEMGKVALDDPLTRHVPGYPNGEHITVLMLLNHTSGIRSYTSIPGYMDAEIRKDLTTAQMIEVFKNQEPEFEPGANWSYNNSGYVLVGAVIEAASGMAWHEWLTKAIFKPLGMTNTGWGHDPAFFGRQVGGYTEDGDGGPVIPMRLLSMTQPHAAGAIVSTVDDLLKWNRGLHEGRVLSDPLYRRMITPVGKAEGQGYGFGILNGNVRSTPSLWHNGGIFGFASSLTYLPGPDITVAVLENDDVDNPGDSADAIARKLAAAALGDPYPEMRAIPVDAATLKAAEGVYRFEGNVRRTLRVVDGRLTGQRDEGRQTPLTPIAPDEYLYEDGFNRIRLERDGTGKITGMRFWAAGDGEGVVGVRSNEPLPAPAVAVAVPRAQLDRLLGTYVNGNLKLRVFFDADQLMAQLEGQGPLKLRAVSSTEFAVDEANARVIFPAGDGPAPQLEIHQGGQIIGLKRQPD